MLIGDPAASSNFAQANKLYPFIKVSDRTRSYLVAALEHLLLWADYAAPLKFHEDHVVNFTLRPAYTLARAAIESSAQAIWLTNTREPRECIRRHLCLIRWDLEEHRKSKSDSAAKDVIRGYDARLLERVSSEFQAKDIQPPKSYLEVIQAACTADELDLDAKTAERLWRAASGAAHGKYWPTIELQQTHVGKEYEPGHFRSVQLPDTLGMAEVLRAAEVMFTYGVLRFADYSGADIAALLREAKRWLLEQVTIREDASPDVLRRLREDP